MTLPKNYKANMNQLTVATNPHQGGDKRVLCVCSAGVLRSPTLANVLHKELGYNTRAVGTVMGFCLIPISEALIHWAEEVVFVELECYDMLDRVIREDIEESGCKVTILDVGDDYDYGTVELEKLLLDAYVTSN